MELQLRNIAFCKNFFNLIKTQQKCLSGDFYKTRSGIVNLLQQLDFCLVSLALSAYCKTFT